jgi:hypothetical protein
MAKGYTGVLWGLGGGNSIKKIDSSQEWRMAALNSVLGSLNPMVGPQYIGGSLVNIS